MQSQKGGTFDRGLIGVNVDGANIPHLEGARKLRDLTRSCDRTRLTMHRGGGQTVQKRRPSMVENTQFLKWNLGAWQLEYAQEPLWAVSLSSFALAVIVSRPTWKWCFFEFG